MTKRFVQQGRNEQKAEAYSLRYDEALSDVKTTLAEICVIFTSGAFRRRTRSTHNAADILRNEAGKIFKHIHFSQGQRGRMGTQTPDKLCLARCSRNLIG
jgi:hypothetical protein